jgi:hypothetical protein
MTAKKWHKVAGFGGLLCHFAMLGTEPEHGIFRSEAER